MNFDRHTALSFSVLAVAFLLALATIYRTVVDADFLREQGKARAGRTETVHVHRGSIFDRRGEPLSVSTPVRTYWIDPGLDQLSSDEINAIANAAGLDSAKLHHRLETASDSRFAYIARRLLPATADRVAALEIDSIRNMTEYRRYYPLGAVAAHVVGITDIDDSGQEGIELALNPVLQGRPGIKHVLRDREGNNIRDQGYERLPRFGRDVMLTIDARIQYLAYKELEMSVAKHQATSASLVMVDVRDGAILAMANAPSYNPNQSTVRNFKRMRNRVVSDVYEPGSTVKPFLMVAALESGQYSLDSEINTHPGHIQVSDKLIEDPVDYGVLKLPRLLAKSSQVGATKIALTLEENALLDVLLRAGFNEPTYLGLPGETAGSLRTEQTTHDVGRAVMAYGYGLTVTPIQLAQSYLTLATGGVRRELWLFEGVPTPPEKRVFPEAIVDQVTSMMEGVVSSYGTASLGQVHGLRIAGKTGTARKVSEKGYQSDRHIALFAGFAPARSPKILMVVVVNEPRGELYSGGAVAAPIFARVIEKTFRLVDESTFASRAGSS